jgi:hypothetical protein
MKEENKAMKTRKLGVCCICATFAIVAMLVLCWYAFKAGKWCGESHKAFAVMEAFKAGMHAKINFTLPDGTKLSDDDAGACLKSFANALKGGKGYCSQYAPLRKGVYGKTFFVCVHNLNCNQNVGDLARRSLHFERLSDLKVFAADYMNSVGIWQGSGPFEPDPEGEYFYDDTYHDMTDLGSYRFWE